MTTLFEPATIIGTVGNQVILAGDVEPMVLQKLAPYRDKMTPQQFDEQRRALMEQVLRSLIDTKLLYLDFLRSLPTDKREEALASIRTRVHDAFYEKKLPELLEEAELKTAAEYDAQLRLYGSSLEKERRAFMERMMSHEMVRRNVQFDSYVSHQEMLDYYRRHADQYELQAKARWERLTVLFDNFPSKREAHNALAEMGNAVLRNAPFDAVARRDSQGPDAIDGGLNDWTEQGSLKSKPIDQAIFSLPLNELSGIIEDDRGYHIIRVLERVPAGRVPFVEAQVGIREAIKEERKKEDFKQYLAKLRDQTDVQTIFDEPQRDNGPVMQARPDDALQTR